MQLIVRDKFKVLRAIFANALDADRRAFRVASCDQKKPVLFTQIWQTDYRRYRREHLGTKSKG